MMSAMGENGQDGRRLGLAGIVGLALLALGLLAAVALLVDPFGWNLLDKVSGLRDEAAQAMPPDTALYAELDLINFDEATITDFSQPFVAALAQPGVEDLGGGIERLDEMLSAEIGLTLREDVMPWLGRSAGLGLTDLTLAPDGSIQGVGWLLVAGSQDRRAADDFLEQLGRQVTELSGIQPAESSYRGQTITSFDLATAETPLSGLAFTRSTGLVILGSDEATVRAAVDAQKNGSLADQEGYRELAAALPEERGLTLYAEAAQAPELSRLLGNVAPLAIGPLDLTSLRLPPGAVGVTIVDEGLRLDTVSPLAGGATAGEVPGPRQMAGLLPAAALAYLTGDSLNGVWGSFKDSLEAGGNLADFEESMALFSREFGFDPDRELLPLLDDEWTLALLPADEGLLADQSGLPLGLVLLAGSGDPAGLEEALAGLNQGLEDQRLPLDTVEVAGATAYFVDLESLLGAPLPLYGIDGQVLFLGTDANSVEQVRTAGTPLAGDSGHARATALLPEGYEAAAFLDLTRLMSLLDGPGDSLRFFEPISQVISGTGPAGEDVSLGVTIIFVE
jgi:hypothetical protein